MTYRKLDKDDERIRDILGKTIEAGLAGVPVSFREILEVAFAKAIYDSQRPTRLREAEPLLEQELRARVSFRDVYRRLEDNTGALAQLYGSWDEYLQAVRNVPEEFRSIHENDDWSGFVGDPLRTLRYDE